MSLVLSGQQLTRAAATTLAVVPALMFFSLRPPIAAAAEVFRLTQMTTSSGCKNFNPSISADGTLLAFGSTCTGANPTSTSASYGVPQVYLLDTITRGRGLTQVALPPGDCGSSNPYLSADGKRLVLNSGCSPIDSNTYLFDTITRGLTQLMTSSDCMSVATPNADGTRVAVESNCNLTGTPTVTPTVSGGIGELFKAHGFDGIAYRSSVGPGHNVALFEIDLAEQANSGLWRAVMTVGPEDATITLRFEEVDPIRRLVKKLSASG